MAAALCYVIKWNICTNGNAPCGCWRPCNPARYTAIMDRIPFSVYDIFGCLVPGFLLLVAGDYALGSATLLHAEPGLLTAFFVAFIAYICGHLIAGIAG